MGMKIRKTIFKTTALGLALFFAVAGYAHAVSNNTCQGECCRKKSATQPESACHDVSLHQALEVVPRSPLCVPRYGDPAAETIQKHVCQDENLPPCCKLAQGNRKTDGLTPTSMLRTDRLLNSGLAVIPSAVDLSHLPNRPVPARYLLPARAAPIPPYLKNSVFLC